MQRPARTFRDVIAWQKAHGLVLSVYRHTRAFPADERFGLTSQIRRASVSVAANIVEGFRRFGLADKRRFLNVAQASLEEVRYYVVLANDLGYLRQTTLEKDAEEVSRLLEGYSAAIRRSAVRKNPPDS